MKRESSLGISLISLIITIIVIIILAAIVIFTGLGTPDSANFAKFASEFSDFNLAITNDYMQRKANYAVRGQTRSKKQIYYEIASGVDVGMDGTPVAVGTTESLGAMMPEELTGTEYYLITSDTNVDGWSKQKQYFEAAEKHYVTDDGEAFFLPGYLVEEGGQQKWWINERKYYVGDAVRGSGDVVNPSNPGEGDDEGDVPATLTGTDGSVVNVLTDSEIDALGNSNLKNSSVDMVVKADTDTGVVPVPTGFTYLLGTEQNGLVIKDASDNEFVWIPVSDVTTMYTSGVETSMNHKNSSFSVTTDKWGARALSA